MKKFSLASALLILLAATAARADFNSGVVAYLQGDYDTAFAAMQALAEAADHGYAQYYLGMMYLKGQGVAGDAKKAGEWFRKAAEKAIPQAQYRLGELYFQGRGVPKDYEFAYIWYSVGATHQHRLSVNAIGKAREKLSREERTEADRLIKSYTLKYGPREDAGSG